MGPRAPRRRPGTGDHRPPPRARSIAAPRRPSVRTPHVNLDEAMKEDSDQEADMARISGKKWPEFPEPTTVRPHKAASGIMSVVIVCILCLPTGSREVRSPDAKTMSVPRLLLRRANDRKHHVERAGLTPHAISTSLLIERTDTVRNIARPRGAGTTPKTKTSANRDLLRIGRQAIS